MSDDLKQPDERIRIESITVGGTGEMKCGFDWPRHISDLESRLAAHVQTLREREEQLAKMREAQWEALKRATAAIYFADNADYEGALHGIVADLDAETSRILSDIGSAEAYEYAALAKPTAEKE